MPRASIGATFLGWAVAAFFTIVFSAIGFALLGGDGVSGDLSLGSLALRSLAVYLVATFLAYLIGGYAAGRISLYHGMSHGLGTVAWAVIFALIGVVAGAYFANLYDVGVRVDTSGLTGYGVLAIALTLLVMLVAAALGGRLGERFHAPLRAGASERGLRRMRGRPL